MFFIVSGISHLEGVEASTDLHRERCAITPDCGAERPSAPGGRPPDRSLGCGKLGPEPNGIRAGFRTSGDERRRRLGSVPARTCDPVREPRARRLREPRGLRRTRRDSAGRPRVGKPANWDQKISIGYPSGRLFHMKSHRNSIKKRPDFRISASLIERQVAYF